MGFIFLCLVVCIVAHMHELSDYMNALEQNNHGNLFKYIYVFM